MDFGESNHKTQKQPRSQERATHSYEPMQSLPESYKAPSKIHEQVVNNMRREIDQCA